MNQRSSTRAPAPKRPDATRVKRRVAVPTETSEEQLLVPANPLTQLQAAAGNRAVSRMVTDGGTIQRKEVTIKGELVEISSILGFVTPKGEKERKEAEEILTTIKDDYGIDVSSTTLIEGIKEQYNKVPEKVTKALKARKWRMNELRALATALSHYAPILGARRGMSTRAGSDQEVTAVGKAAQAIDTNKPAGKLDTTTLGEYFKGKKVMGIFKASEGFHDVFQDENEELVGTFIHEIAHGLLAYAYDDFVAESGGFWTDQDTKSGAEGTEKPPTDYGNKNAREDMCDTASLYFIKPERLNAFPKRKAFMAKVGKDWVPPLRDLPTNIGGGDPDQEKVMIA